MKKQKLNLTQLSKATLDSKSLKAIKGGGDPPPYGSHPIDDK